MTARYSTTLTDLLGNKAVPVLGTLFLLSYMKLLRIVATFLEVSYLKFTEGTDSIVTHSLVWAVDGNLSYFGFPHIMLFMVGLATLVFLCVPTVLIVLMQWIRRLLAVSLST